MKNFFDTLYEIFERIGRARAAAHFARNGMYEQAKAIMLAK